MTGARIGIDFGGTKIEIAALDGDGGEAMRHRVPNPGNYDAALDAVRDLVASVEEKLGPAASIGIGTPGARAPRTGLMRNANSVWLNGRPFKTDLEAKLGRKIAMANDANCFALSEARDGAAAGQRIVFGVILGTGCGGGLMIDGRMIEGGSGLAGEIGHVPLPWPHNEELPAPRCWCGLTGCLELWVSGSGFSRAFAAATGRDLPAPEIVNAARAGGKAEQAALEAYMDRLARGLAVVADIVDPDCFVLGGGMSNVTELYDGMPERVQRYTFSKSWEGVVVQAKWGDSSGVRGAAMLHD